MALCYRQYDVIPKGYFSSKPKSLDYNSQERLVLIAGRKILKILTLSEDNLSFKYNLLTKDREGLNCCDAKWSPFSNCTLATTEKCNIQVWNLQFSQKDKFVTEFRAADIRALNKISFSHFKRDILISGSQDSIIRGFDIHNNKKIFELAYSDEIVRDVQFSPTSENYIASNYDDGLLAVWDLRKSDHPLLKYQAHTEPAFCLAWHPEQSFIATGGRDKKIRICSVKGSEMECCFTLHALNNPVARVCWIPQSLNGQTLASISCVGDSFINFWDITKPYSVPYKRSTEQKHALIDFCWINQSELISCTNNGIVMTHSEQSAVLMADSINEISLACNNYGVIQHTFKQFTPIVVPLKKGLEEIPHEILRPQWSTLSTVECPRSRNISPRDRSQSVNIPRENELLQVNMKNSLHMHSLSSTYSDFALNRTNVKEVNDPIVPIYKRSKEFVQFAREYRFKGETPMNLCRHNEKLAKKMGRQDIGFLWYFCQFILTNKKKLAQGVINLDAEDLTANLEGEIKGHYVWDIDFDNKQTNSKSIPVTPHSNTTSFFEMTGRQNEAQNQKILHEKFSNFTQECELEERFETCSPPNKVIDVFSMINKSERAWWTETDVNVHSMSGSKISPYKESKLHSTTTTHKHLVDSVDEIGLSVAKTEEITFKKRLSTPSLNFIDTLVAIINNLVDNGEFQHVVVIYLCVYEKLLNKINPFTFTHWASAYIDLLQAFNFDLLACELYKFLHTLDFYQEILDNQDKENFCTLRDWDNSSYMTKFQCKSCKKPVSRTMPCEECNAWSKHLCSVCRLPIYGLCVWCKGCLHGGHREHILDWFKTERACPFGCGHLCVL